MRRFEWRLQKLLDLKNKQEEALRAELISVTEQAVGLRGQILMERALLRQRLTETERMPAAKRMARQEFVLQFSQVTETAIREMDRKLEQQDPGDPDGTKVPQRSGKAPDSGAGGI